MPTRINYSQTITEKVIKLYTEKLYNCLHISRELNLKPHQVSTILKRNNIKIEKVGINGRQYRSLSDSTKLKIANGLIGKPGSNLGKKFNTRELHTNIKAQLKMPDLDLSKYCDYDKLTMVKSWLIQQCRDGYRKTKNVEYVQSFLDKFYFDDYFNLLYSSWLTDQDRNKKPSLDHIIPKSRGGSSFDLSNLQVLTWFENRAKNNMTYVEWLEFRSKYELDGTLFKEKLSNLNG